MRGIAVADRNNAKKGFDRLANSLEILGSKLGNDPDWVVCQRFLAQIFKFSRGCADIQMALDRIYLTLLPYREYLKTEHWKELREAALLKAGNRCRTCNSDGELHTHHRTYENLGQEPESDLIILCKKCHELFHKNLELIEAE